MKIGDLLFILAFLISVVVLLRVVYLTMRRRTAQAIRLGGRWVVFAAAYLAVLVAVSLVQPQRRVSIGEEQCFDDWCIVVDSVSRPDSIGAARANGAWVVVTTRVTSYMRDRRQSEPDAYGYIIDAAGNRIEESARGHEALSEAGLSGSPIGSFVEPGGSFVSRLVFDVPRSSTGLGFVKERRARFPTITVVGDPASLLHRRTVVPLETMQKERI